MVKLIVNHTTAVVRFTLNNFHVDESRCGNFRLTDRIVDVHGNYIHIGNLKKHKKRRPTVYWKKRSGDLEAFDSQIQISVTSLIIEDKLYKFKAFRNGSGVVPGVLFWELDDVYEPLQELCRYLSEIYEIEITATDIAPVTRNYKVRIDRDILNVRKLLKLLDSRTPRTYRVSIAVIEQILARPIVNTGLVSWNNIMLNDSDIDINIDACIDSLINFDPKFEKKNDILSFKFIVLDGSCLEQIFSHATVHATYRKVMKYLRMLYIQYGIQFTDDDISYLMLLYMKEFSQFINEPKCLHYYINDRINRVTINLKPCTIVVYTSGKINLHAIESKRHLSEMLVWLKDLLNDYEIMFQTIPMLTTT